MKALEPDPAETRFRPPMRHGTDRPFAAALRIPVTAALLASLPAPCWALPDLRGALGLGAGLAAWRTEEPEGTRSGQAEYGRISYSADNFHAYPLGPRYRVRVGIGAGNAHTSDDATFRSGDATFTWGYGDRDHAAFVEGGYRVSGFEGSAPAYQRLSYAALGLYSGPGLFWEPPIVFPVDRQFLSVRAYYDDKAGRTFGGMDWELWKRIGGNLAISLELDTGPLFGDTDERFREFGPAVELGIKWLQ